MQLPFSSGTTGLPKGVELTHRNLIVNLQQMYPGEVSVGPLAVLNVDIANNNGFFFAPHFAPLSSTLHRANTTQKAPCAIAPSPSSTYTAI